MRSHDDSREHMRVKIRLACIQTGSDLLEIYYRKNRSVLTLESTGARVTGKQNLRRWEGDGGGWEVKIVPREDVVRPGEEILNAPSMCY